MWGTLAATTCREPLAKPSQRVLLVHGAGAGAFGACTALHQTLHYRALHHLHHMTRDLPALGRGWGIGVGWGMNQHFQNLFLPPAKGQYETKPRSQGPQNPCRLSKPTSPTHDKFFGEKLAGEAEGEGHPAWNARQPDRALFIPPALLVRDPTQRYPTPAEDADGQNMDPPMDRTPPLSILCLL